MNPPASTENQGDQISWVWDHPQQQQQHHHNQSHNHNHPAVTMSIGLETRQFQGGGRVLAEYDWGSSPVLLSGGQGIAQDAEERKPQMISAAGSVMENIGQYSGNGNGNGNGNVNLAVNGMLSSGFGHNIISPNSMGNLFMSSSAGTRSAYGGHHHQHHHHNHNHHVLDGIRSGASPSSLLYSGGNSALSGFGSGYTDSSRTAMEEHRNHILGLMGMDQKNIFHNVVKTEDLCAGDFQARIGLNLGLGGRTYFSSEDNIVNRLYKRPRAISPGSQVPRCQAEGCKADLSAAKHYHRRHKVCELHSKAATVVSGGLTQRFCQQCSRFHVLSEFDEGKRSCRKRLADHNRRRRKPQPNAVVSVSNTESSSALKNTDQEQDTNSGSNQSSLQQPEQISRSEAPGLLTGISLSQSLPLVLQTGKGQEPYLQQTGPNLSLGGEIALDYPRHSTGGENYNGLEIPIPWLRPAGSGSEFGGSEKNSSNGQVSESGGGGGSSSTVFTSIQNLLPLQSSTELGTSDWMVNGNISGSSSRGQHYGPADLNLQTSLEGQQMLSLLEKDVRSSNVDTDQHNTQDAVEYFSHQQGMNSKHSVDGHSEHRNQLNSSFSGMQSLRSLSQSMYQNIL